MIKVDEFNNAVGTEFQSSSIWKQKFIELRQDIEYIEKKKNIK